jgi:tellurite resistance protein
MFKKKAAGGNFRDRFSAEEWSLAMSVPFLFFGMTASADGSVDQAEAAELQRRMQGGAIGYKDPLHREVAAQFFSTPVTIDELLGKANAVGPEKVRDTLRKRLSEDEYQGYLGSVLIDAMGVAKASGGVSDTETTALTALAAFFGIDVAGLKDRFGG